MPYMGSSVCGFLYAKEKRPLPGEFRKRLQEGVCSAGNPKEHRMRQVTSIAYAGIPGNIREMHRKHPKAGRKFSPCSPLVFTYPAEYVII